jgi:TonB-linked SusC/RagA family outer membrane protein
MKKLLLVSLCFLLLSVTQVFAQNRTVTGTVTAKDDGTPIPGVTVKVKGTSTAVSTNADGKFSISASPGSTLVFSVIGYESVSLSASKAVVNVTLSTSAKELGEVQVTTSLGIKHSESELGYASAQITAKDLTETNVTNLANGLTAKVAGLGIFTLDNSIDPTVSIVLRGNRSLEGNNTALIVLDGVPIPGATIGSINPNDVADVTVLKGAGAAALYGSAASNGAILITTKRGTTGGKPVITYGNSLQIQNIAYYPKIQNQFGQFGGEPSYVDPLTGFTEDVPFENQLYGPAFNGQQVKLGAPLDSINGKQQYITYSPYKTNPIKAFFNTGVTEQNDISFSEGDSKNSFFMSAQNVNATGIVPNDKNIKNAFSVRGHRTYGDFYVDYSVGYTKTNVSTYGYGWNGANLYTTVLQLPADLNIKAYSDPNGLNSIGNANNFYDAYAINPYWIVDDARRNYERDVLLSNVKLGVTPTNWLDVSYRMSADLGFFQERDTEQEVDFTKYATSDPLQDSDIRAPYANTLKVPGSVFDYSQFGDGANGYDRLEGDALVNLHHTFFNDFKTNLVLGNTIFQNYTKFQETGSGSLLLPDFYNISQITGQPYASEYSAMVRQIAYFAEATIDYKGYLTLDATYRNEQDSRLSAAERSFNYPSVKLAFVPTEAFSVLKNNDILSYAKLYGSLSRVGNITIGPYEINPVYNLAGGFPYGSVGGTVPSGELYSPTLKPELTSEFETGAELDFFKSRLGLNVTYYNQHDKNQTLPINISTATGYGASLVNIGETQSYGEEFTLNGQILTQQQNRIGWTLGGNFAINQSKVISLGPNTNSIDLGNNEYAVVGKPFPLLEGTDFVRDPAGRVVVNSTTGYPSTNSNTLTDFGRTSPKYTVGLNTSVSYKFVSLSAVAEYRGGDVVFDQVGQTFTFAGSSALTAEAGRERFIYPNSVIQTASGAYVPNTNVVVQNGQYGFWQGSAFTGTMSPYITSGAFWKLREVNLSFKLDQWLKKSKVIKAGTFSLTGRDLFMWLPKTNIYSDPEFSNSGSTGTTRGVSTDNITPGTRLFGADLKLTF